MNLNDITDTIRGTVIGIIGTWLTLSNINTIVAIIVGLLTATYLCAKLFFLFKNNGRQ